MLEVLGKRGKNRSFLKDAILSRALRKSTSSTTKPRTLAGAAWLLMEAEHDHWCSTQGRIIGQLGIDAGQAYECTNAVR